ncbi:hypothetical protein VagYM19_17410 [Vibrio alginolyticus]|uniref:helix-turn-helix transcriptional regulator n=1 Tax=Vibrio TaxID=662 RepID=UPI0014359E60|nr:MULTISPECIES: helix-turn-helix transcriptional regulator [Vibrio]BCB42613.1 hypothetical protein Vag1382_17390 [Vibrio alginolyticus]NNN55252.1 helix-turn-helix transcriptional regulator [Vibrio sp. 1-2 (7-a)]BCB47213.1 hypothetical protein VagVIO5_17390 [Vibrio alginolyticus]BCB51815.1 hypothetical protein VagYM19_17410 [Vibrio alginolyticus]BCB56418.1 hypothetical protein VagYM4_17410 [Vibrio alginolyticus]
MKFSSFIKKTRANLSLSQNEIVDKLISGHSKFYNLNTTTYNRWENDHTTPSTFKIYLILRILELDVIDSYKKLSLRLSNSKLKPFIDLINYLDNNQNRFRLLSSTLPQLEEFKTFDKSNYSDSTELLTKIKGSINNIIRQSETKASEKDIEHIIEMQKARTIVITACKNHDTDTYTAQCAWIYLNTSFEKDFISIFKKKELRLRDLNFGNREQESFIFSIPTSLHSGIWNHYFIKELIKETINNPPKRIYVFCLNSEALRLYLNLGFKTVASISNRIKINSNINEIVQYGKTYLLSIEYEDFISHHGVIQFIKES